MSRFVRSRSIGFAICLGLFACNPGCPEPPVVAEAAPSPPHVARAEVWPASAARRRALLVGINDYSASRLPPAPAGAPPGRRFVPNLRGAFNDIQAMREILLSLYGFAEQDILVLTDQEATRVAILQAIEKHLTEPSGPGDIAFFYFSGHGSQATNTRTDEPDEKDETLVPADSLRGAPDIRDKELRRLFNRILDRGAVLTIGLDSCHSASGARGLLTGAGFRSVEPAPHTVTDASPAGPRPENRGALVVSAAQEHDLAWESWDEQNQPQGAFSLALARALRDSVADEPAEETFLRARARLQAERRYQEPALAGATEARRAPFLGRRAGQRNGRTVVAVESVQGNGTVVLQGGFANGLTVGSVLQVLPPHPKVRLEVTAIHSFSRSDGRVLPGSERPALPKPGALAEVVQWTARPDVPLRVWMGEAGTAGDFDAATALAGELAREAPRQGIRWSEEPTGNAPTHVLRRRGEAWELLTAETVGHLGPVQDAASVLERIHATKKGKTATLFVQLPAPGDLVRAVSFGPGTDHSGVEATDRPEDADYVLAGRHTAGGPQYAWLRPGAAETDRERSSLPVRTAWQTLGTRDPASGLYRTAGRALEDAVLRLRKIHAWIHLETPPGADSPYELALRKDGGKTDGELIANDRLVGQESYRLVLRAREARLPALAEPRYFYVFVLDSFGKSILLFPPPPSGSVGNRFPVTPGAPAEISLGPAGTFRVVEPYGLDTYFLLSTDEPIHNPWVLEWEGARTRGPLGATPLEELLSVTGGTGRAVARNLVPAVWSVERKLFTSVTPGPSFSAKSNP